MSGSQIKAPGSAGGSLLKIPAICLAPEYIAEELLRLEGFSEIEYVGLDALNANNLVTANRADLTVDVPPLLLQAARA